jgi:putative tricarboxylic transport membrane protein
MDAFAGLLQGFDVALKPINLLWGFVGVTLGTFVGVLPGVGPALTVAMLLPLTAQLDPTGALIMFAGIYYGAMSCVTVGEAGLNSARVSALWRSRVLGLGTGCGFIMSSGELRREKLASSASRASVDAL